MFIFRRMLNLVVKEKGLITAILAHLGLNISLAMIGALLMIEKMKHYIHSEEDSQVN